MARPRPTPPLARLRWPSTRRRLEDRGQMLVRHAWPAVAHRHDRNVSAQLQSYADDRLLRRVTDGVAHNVLDRSVQELPFARRGASFFHVQLQAAALGLGLEAQSSTRLRKR